MVINLLIKEEEKLKKTRNRINPISQEDFQDNNINFLFSIFNTLNQIKWKK